MLQNKDALGITAARPALDRGGKFAGVMGANLTLGSISEYLKGHPVNGQVVAYVVEPGGALVATSSPDTRLAIRAAGKASRVLAGDAVHPVIPLTYQALQRERERAGPGARTLAVRSAR